MLNYENINYPRIPERTERKKITRHKQRETPAEPPQKPMVETADSKAQAESIAKLSPAFEELNYDEKRQAVEHIRKDLESQSKEQLKANEKPSE